MYLREQRFISNERRLCALDFHYYLNRYCWIIDWRRQPSRFIPNVAQQIVMWLWAESEAMGHAIWMQQLKARRLGVSTISELAINHRFQFHSYSNCVIASADPDKTVEMAKIIGFNIQRQPWWLLPQAKPKIYQGMPVEYPDIHTGLTIAAGNQFTGVARGSTPSVVHLSELCEWVDAADLIDAALLPAIIDSVDTFGILESTAKGPGWWKDTWEQNKRDYPRGRGRLRPVFLPWYVGTDIYPSPAWLVKQPIPGDWTPSESSIKHAIRAHDYVVANSLMFKYLAAGNPHWQMSREQMWFREANYESAKEKKELHIFLAEYCADDFEAFQSPNITVIDPEILIGYQERTRQPIGVYTIIGPDIPESLITPRRYWDGSQPTITIKTKELTPKHDLVYQLVPIRFEGYDQLDEELKILIWEHPSDAYVYGIGVDTSEGIGQDNAIIQVLREAIPSREPGQVLEFATGFTTAFQLWPFAMAIASYYSVYAARLGQRAQARCAIECWANGAVVQNEMQKRGWSNFHPWKSYDNRKPRRDGEVNKLGVYTNQSFRAQMVDLWLSYLAEEAIDVPSPYLVNELRTLERQPGQIKVAAALGAHDDRFMGLGFPLFSLHMSKPAQLQFVRRRIDYIAGLSAEPAQNYASWSAPMQAQSEPFRPAPEAQVTTRSQRPAGQVVQRLEHTRGRYSLRRFVNEHMPKGFR